MSTNECTTQDLIDLTVINRSRVVMNRLLEPLIVDPFDKAALQKLAQAQKTLGHDVERAARRRGSRR